MSSESRTEAMSERKLEEIEKRAEAATEGEWWVTLGSGDNLCTAIHAEDESGNMTFIADFLPDWALKTAEKDHRPNMNFCLHARQDIPNLLSQVRRSHTEAAELREENEKLDNQNTSLIQRLEDCARVSEGCLATSEELKREAAELREQVEQEERVKLEWYYELAGCRERELHLTREVAGLREEKQQLDELAKGVNKMREGAELENSELREKVEEFEGALHRCLMNQATVHFGWVDSKPWCKVHAPQRIAEGETFLEVVHAALSQASAQAKLENQGE